MIKSNISQSASSTTNPYDIWKTRLEKTLMFYVNNSKLSSTWWYDDCFLLEFDYIYIHWVVNYLCLCKVSREQGIKADHGGHTVPFLCTVCGVCLNLYCSSFLWTMSCSCTFPEVSWYVNSSLLGLHSQQEQQVHTCTSQLTTACVDICQLQGPIWHKKGTDVSTNHMLCSLLLSYQ